MFEMSKALKQCEKLTDEERIELFAESFKKVNEATRIILKDDAKAFSTTLSVVLYSAAADGKFEEEEYALIAAMIKAATDRSLSYPEAKSLVESVGDPEEEIDFLRDYFIAVCDVSDDAGIAYVCLMMTTLAIDGDVSYKEKKWMKKVF